MKKQFTLSAVLVFLVLTSAFGQSIPIQWNPVEVFHSIGDGIGADDPVSVTFLMETDLTDVEFWVDPALQPFVKVEPARFSSVAANTPVQLHFSIPRDALQGLYKGAIHVRGDRTKTLRPTTPEEDAWTSDATPQPEGVT